MPDAAISSAEQAGDEITDYVVGLVTMIAEAGGATLPEISLRAKRSNETVGVRLEVVPAWDGDFQTVNGYSDPSGSARCANDAQAKDSRDAACAAAVADPATIASAADRLRADPVGNLRTLADGHRLDGRVWAFHSHARCNTCSGNGRLTCDVWNCNDGKVPCSCNDGKDQCFTCQGSGNVRVEVWYNQSNGERAWRYDTERCGTCYGSGRSGYCPRCYGNLRVTCSNCSGNGTIQCRSCGGHGGFTTVRRGWLTGRVSRSRKFAENVPFGFKLCAECIPEAEMLPAHGDLEVAQVTAHDDCAVGAFICTLPYVAVQATIRGAEEEIDAIGKTAIFPLMPTFLDRMLAEVALKIHEDVAQNRASAAILAARATGVTSRALEAAAKSGSGGHAALTAMFHQALSTEMATRLLEDLRLALSGVGKRASRDIWRLGGLVTTAVAATAMPLGLAHALLDLLDLPSGGGHWVTEVAAAAAMTAVPYILTWYAARRAARAAVRAHVGDQVMRAPGTSAMAAAIGAAAIVALGGGFVAVMTPGGLLPQSVYAALPGKLFARLSPTDPALADFPRLTEPPSGQMKGDPATYRLQFLLAELGLYKGAPDGAAASPATKAAMEALRRATPHSPEVQGKTPVQIAEMGLRDSFVYRGLTMEFPLRAVTPVRGLTTAALGHVPAEDVPLVADAVSKAYAAPGEEMSWVSADGKRGGRVVSEPYGVYPRFTCASFDIEVRADGFAEQTGVGIYCRASAKTQWKETTWLDGQIAMIN